ncbi:TniQ family protein [Cupriavidus pinatubonensis]|uniref:TniQ family protein n=1 Tax=Cupriavidus pinatubonensis TaxID=248026 RepID=UPI003605F48F
MTLYPVEMQARRSPARQPIPIYIEPMPGEALASWLCRLASKIALPPLAFIRHAFGIDCRSDAQWWRRPSREQLAIVAAGTRVSLERLAAMTLADWSLARLDEHPQRLDAQYALHPPAQHAADRFTAACLRCLAEDEHPYVRRDWMIGWLAACPRHQCRLLHRCPTCRAELRIGDLRSRDAVVIDRCRRCGSSWRQLGAPAADPAAIELQDRLLDMKHRGVAVLPGLGRVEWASFMAVADLVAAAMWRETADYHRERLFERILRDLDMHAGDRVLVEWPSNYGALLTLAWLMADWPTRLELMLEELHAPGIEGLLDQLPDLDDGLRQRLPDLLGPAWHHRQQAVPGKEWRVWLKSIVASGMDFRTMARKEVRQGYTERLVVFAMLAEGRSIEEGAAWAGLKPETIERWIEVAVTYGIHMVIEKPARVCDLTPDQAHEIRQWLASATWLLSPRTGWRADHVRGEIARRFDLNISVSAAQSLLPKVRTSTSLPDHAESRN